MSKQVTKAADNVYCKARLEAAKNNDSLRSREGASEQLGLSKEALTKYELGLCKVVPVESVVMMSEVYNAPELLSFYCSKECPIGSYRNMEQLEVKSIEMVTLQMVNILRGVEKTKGTLLDITYDGKITQDEIPKLNDILAYFDEVIQKANELKLWAEKHIKNI